MNDTDKHERVAPALHPIVIEWCERILIASRRYKEPPEVVADFERLAEMARGDR